MSWRQAATFLVVVFIIVAIQSALAGPLFEVQNGLIDAVSFNNAHFDGPGLIRGMVSTWFDMGLVAIFFLGGSVIALLVRRELTRQGRPPQ